jgi:predicted protein tyrosine phosphatase
MIPPTERSQVDRVTDVVFLGSRIANLGDYHRLRGLGIRACVDMKHEGADPWTFEAFLWLPTVDHEAPSQAHLHMGIAFLRQCEIARLPVFVHCMAGVGRSASLVLAFLLAGAYREQGAAPALAFLGSRRAVVNPTPFQVQAAVDAAATFQA